MHLARADLTTSRRICSCSDRPTRRGAADGVITPSSSSRPPMSYLVPNLGTYPVRALRPASVCTAAVSPRSRRLPHAQTDALRGVSVVSERQPKTTEAHMYTTRALLAADFAREVRTEQARRRQDRRLARQARQTRSRNGFWARVWRPSVGAQPCEHTRARPVVTGRDEEPGTRSGRLPLAPSRCTTCAPGDWLRSQGGRGQQARSQAFTERSVQLDQSSPGVPVAAETHQRQLQPVRAALSRRGSVPAADPHRQGEGGRAGWRGSPSSRNQWRTLSDGSSSKAWRALAIADSRLFAVSETRHRPRPRLSQFDVVNSASASAGQWSRPRRAVSRPTESDGHGIPGKVASSRAKAARRRMTSEPMSTAPHVARSAASTASRR